MLGVYVSVAFGVVCFIMLQSFALWGCCVTVFFKNIICCFFVLLCYLLIMNGQNTVGFFVSLCSSSSLPVFFFVHVGFY